MQSVLLGEGDGVGKEEGGRGGFDRFTCPETRCQILTSSDTNSRHKKKVKQRCLSKSDQPASGLKAYNIVLPLDLLQQTLVLLLLLRIALLQHCQVISTHAQQPLHLP